LKGLEAIGALLGEIDLNPLPFSILEEALEKSVLGSCEGHLCIDVVGYSL
jgi:hypothetical protein